MLLTTKKIILAIYIIISFFAPVNLTTAQNMHVFSKISGSNEKIIYASANKFVVEKYIATKEMLDIITDNIASDSILFKFVFDNSKGTFIPLSFAFPQKNRIIYIIATMCENDSSMKDSSSPNYLEYLTNKSLKLYPNHDFFEGRYENDDNNFNINYNTKKEIEVSDLMFYDGHFYTFQIASFRDEKRALKQCEFLRNKKIPVFYYEVDLADKGKWFRVRIGPVTSTIELKKFLTKIH